MADARPPGEKKRVSLPVVGEGAKKTLLDQAELGDDAGGAEGRGPWSWVLLGAMAIFVVLVPLAMVTMAVLRRVAPQDDAVAIGPLVVASVFAVGIASFAGGWLVGRFGPRMTARFGAAAGALAGVVLWALSKTWIGVVVLAVTTPLAALGAHLGRRQRAPKSK